MSKQSLGNPSREIRALFRDNGLLYVHLSAGQTRLPSLGIRCTRRLHYSRYIRAIPEMLPATSVVCRRPCYKLGEILHPEISIGRLSVKETIHVFAFRYFATNNAPANSRGELKTIIISRDSSCTFFNSFAFSCTISSGER